MSSNNNIEEKKVLFYVKLVEVVEDNMDDDGIPYQNSTVFYLYSNNVEDFKNINHGTLKPEIYPITDMVGYIYRRHQSPYVLTSNTEVVSFPVAFSTIENAKQWLKNNSVKKLCRKLKIQLNGELKIQLNDHQVTTRELIPVDQFNEWFMD